MVVTCLVLCSAVAAFALSWLSDILNLRGLATPQQRQWGTMTWAVGTGLLILAPTLAIMGVRLIPRWLMITYWGLLTFCVLQVGAVLAFPLFGLLLPILLPDEWVGVTVMTTGVVGLYALGSRAAEARRNRLFFQRVAFATGAVTSAAIIVGAVWACLFFE